MVRSISGTLLTAQNALSGTIYINLLFTSKDGNTTHDYSSDLKGRRILLIDHNEEAYGGARPAHEAFIVLRNDDRTIPALKGFWVEIGYGYVTGSGNEHSQTARLWVKHQQDVSGQGKRVTILELEGMWANMIEKFVRIGNPPFYRDEEGTLRNITVYAALVLIVAEAGMTLAALVEDDGIMGTYQPSPELNNIPFESAGALAYWLVSMTKSYLRSKQSLVFEVKYPQSTDAVDITYYSDQAPFFNKYIERTNVLIPNDVIVFANEGADGLFTDLITGDALDQTEIDAYDTIRQLIVAGKITTQSDANNRAASILARAKAEQLAGMMFAKHDCQLELYDRISIEDSR